MDYVLLFKTLNDLQLLSMRMQEEDPEHALEWWRVGYSARTLLHAALDLPRRAAKVRVKV